MLSRLFGWFRRPQRHIRTYSGIYFYPLAPDPERIRIEDIAHALSHQCRFSGHTRVHYSVAQHSVMVAHEVPPADRLWGLLHDAAEAYMVDIPTPIKLQIPKLIRVEDRLLRAVARRYGLPIVPGTIMPLSVKLADARVLNTEFRDLFDPPRNCAGQPICISHITPWSSYRAEEAFLALFRALHAGA
jgi:uncharacterized protein